MVPPSEGVTISVQTPIAELVWHVQQRDVAAHTSFEVLYMLKSPSIYGHIKSLVHDPGVAEDLHNETFWSAWLKLPDKDPNAPFDNWLHRIAIHKAIDWLRHEKKFEFVPLPKEELEDGEYQTIPPLADGGPGTEEQVCDLENVRRLLARLSPTARICVQLHVQWGFTQKEIAEILSTDGKCVDPRRVNDHIRRARKALRDLYPSLADMSKTKGKGGFIRE